MKTEQMICKKCHGQMELSADGRSMICRSCTASELVPESDAVKETRIKADAAKEIVLEKKRIDSDTQIKEQNLELEKEKFRFNSKISIVKLVIFIILLLAAISLVIFAGYKIAHINKVQTHAFPYEYKNDNYLVVAAKLKDVGFADIETVCSYCLDKSDPGLFGTVTSVAINGSTSFDRDTWFSKNAHVIVHYQDLDPQHEQDIQIPESSSFYLLDKYQIVIAELQDAGFIDVEAVPTYCLDKSRPELFGTVTSVTINGSASFDKDTWFSKDAHVIVQYQDLNPQHEQDIRIPGSSSAYLDAKYQVVKAELQNAGFTCIETVPLEDLDKSQSSQIDTVAKITIDGSSTFSADNWYSPDIPVFITYHTLNPEHKNDIMVPNDSNSFKNLSYSVVAAEFKSYGFPNVKLQPMNDIGFLSKIDEGSVDRGQINNNSNFKGGIWMPADAQVIIYYHSKSSGKDSDLQLVSDNDVVMQKSAKEYKGEIYVDVEKELRKNGFTNITCTGLEDLIKAWLYDEGEVKSVVIDGNDSFKKGAVYPCDVTIEIQYHSMRKDKNS